MVRSFLGNGRIPYGTSSSRKRHDHARHPSSNTTIARGTFLFVLFLRGGQLIIPWDETFTAWQAGPTVPGQAFGTIMCEMAVRDQLDGTFRRQFKNSCMNASLDLSYSRLSADLPVHGV